MAIPSPADTEALEALYPTDDIDQRVERTQLVQHDLSGRPPVHAPLGFADQHECFAGPLPYPIRDIRSIDHGDQIAHPPVRPMVVLVAVNLLLGPVGLTRPFRPAVRERDRHFRGLDAVPIDPPDVHRDLGNPQPGLPGSVRPRLPLRVRASRP